MGLIVLVGGGWVLENGRGNRAWEEAQARAKEAGVPLVRSAYADRSVPDERNLLTNRVFRSEFHRPEKEHLKSWFELPGIDGNPGYLSPSSGQTVNYQRLFVEAVRVNFARHSFLDSCWFGWVGFALEYEITEK